MLTEKIDPALDALLSCTVRLPALRDLYRVGTTERAVLDDAIEALARADAVLFGRQPCQPLVAS